MLVGDDAVEVAGDGADVAVDGPLVVIEDDDEALGLLGDVVEGFERDAVGEGGVAGDGDDVFFAAGEIARHCHAERRGERGAGVTCAVAVVLALGAQHEAVEAAGLADGCKAVEAAGEDLVNVGLVADVEEELVFGVSNTVCSARVSSTTPRLGPRWPPVLERVWMRNARISSASSAICAELSRFTSAGE